MYFLLAKHRLTEIIHNVQGSFIQIFIKIGNSEIEGDNLPDFDNISIVESSELKNIQMSLNEAKKVTDFSIILPEYIPLGFHLTNVTVIKQEDKEKSEEIFIHYRGEKRGFSIHEMIVKDELGLGETVDRDDTIVEKVTINNKEVSLLSYKNNQLKLSWVDQNYYYSIEGELTNAEALKIAESMK